VTGEPSVAVVIVAAGSGTRLGGGIPKGFVALGGVPLVERAVHAARSMGEPVQVVSVVPATLQTRAEELLGSRATVVAGGESRQQSVAAGLAALVGSVRTVLVHDAARALAPASLFDAVVDAVRRTGGGVVPGLPVADTIKRLGPDGAVLATIDRSELSAVQTPQGFPRASLEKAYGRAEQEYTDDAAVFAAAGQPVIVVPGHPLAFKITTPADLARAEQLLAPGAPPRTGIGIDVHAFGGDGELRLATLAWPGEPPLAGHSDGDAVAHAICDALLSAAGLGDIGERFGTADPRYAGAEGAVFLRETLALLRANGFEPGNVSVQIVAARPRFSARRREAEAALSALIGAPVSVTATTSDGLGFTGRGEGVAAIATALVRPAARLP
jgi:2-C-methyl-D-erythritol 4-phosphate cytidylyltransferase/2-C-methyl-D-erythritol 2,4-cyclodiphosphate synthase